MHRTPQAFDRLTTLRLHLTLIAALSPVAIVAGFSGGWTVGFLIASTMAVGWLADALLRLLSAHSDKDDASSVLWGLLLALLMPPTIPFWVPWAGICFSIFAVKGLLGGNGSPWLNPVLTGWAFCQAGWPTQMRPSLSLSGIEPARILSSLADQRSTFDRGVTDWLNGNLFSWLNIQLPSGYIDLFTGLGPGTHAWIGESGTVFLLAATVFLLVRGTIPWQIPTFFFVGFALPLAAFGGIPTGSGLASGDVLFHVFSGTFLLGIFFLATDSASRPLTKAGMVVFALGAGALSFLLRTWGGHPEGVGYAILLMNFLVPWLDSRLRKKVLNDLR